jgi:transcriptional regulator with PAS, ATPase and Fis domain
MNCGAIPPSLVESHLFGYAAGAFTGALKEGHQGLFEQANGGTLFLDEISEMNLELQSRLLRVLQERELVRIGGKKVIPVNVRVIASTNKDLWEMVTSGKFRQDLYYRLNVIELRIPPLRDRIEDLPVLIRSFIGEFKTNFGSFIQDISKEALECLVSYSWPGNVRELRNCVERIMNLSTNEVIKIEDIPAVIREKGNLKSNGHRRAQPWTIPGEPAMAGLGSLHNQGPEMIEPLENSYSRPLLQTAFLKGSTQATEHTAILQALERSAYNRQRAARMLGISSTTLWRKMKKLGISPSS